MTINSYRSNVERTQKEIADLEKRRSQENSTIAKLLGDINSIQQSITKSTSSSTLQLKRSQIASKHRAISQAQDKVADYSKRIADKTGQLNRTLQSLARVETQERQKFVKEEKNRRDEELQHAKAVTREIERQTRLYSQLSRNPVVIDITKLPTTINVVIFAPDPIDPNLDRLRLDNEIREIALSIRASEYRDSVKIIPCLATQPRDVLQAINEHEPKIVHFSGHGNEDEIAFVDPTGNLKLVSKAAIVQVMQVSTDTIQLVVFNTCLSKQHAQAVTEYIDIAIGMNDEIGDEAARIFAAQFYSAIGFGQSVQKAFSQAIAALMLEGIPEENTPELFTREGVDADQIILVRPF